MIAFAANSLLCRLALKTTSIDASSFTAIRLVAGAFVLMLLTGRIPPNRTATAAAPPEPAFSGDWPSAMALACYAACFSWAYVGLPAATGALLLFGSVQAAMIGMGLRRGERLAGSQWAGLVVALGGLLALLLPNAEAPAWDRAALMLVSGGAWGVYSLRGRGVSDPLGVTAGNFRRAAILSVCIVPAFAASLSIDLAGALFALASGALASGLGYAIWYAALRGLSATGAAAVQLCVPVLAGLGAALWLDESFTLRLACLSAVVLGGVALVVARRRAGRARG